MRKITRLTAATLLFTFLILSAIAQKEYLTPNKNYSAAKIYTKKYKVLRVSRLELINDSTISFKNKNTKEVEQLSTNSIRYLDVKKGSKALAFGLYGAGVGLLGVLAAVGSTVGDSNREFRDNLGLRIALIIGGAAALGAGIGALTPKWKRKYINKENQSTTFIFYPGIYKNNYSVNLLITF